MTPYMKTIFQQKKTEILTKISGSAPLSGKKSKTFMETVFLEAYFFHIPEMTHFWFNLLYLSIVYANRL